MCGVLYILVCDCYVVSKVLHNTSINVVYPDIEVHTVHMVYGGKTECAMSIHTCMCV